MTTQNAMIEQQTADKIRDLELKVAHLERADEYSRKAINQLIKTLEEKREIERSKRVEAEREACAKLVEDVAEAIRGSIRPKTFIGALMAAEAKVSLLEDIAKGIRARSSETSSTVEG
jgi:DNA-binding MarR family transcriptional regulator